MPDPLDPDLAADNCRGALQGFALLLSPSGREAGSEGAEEGRRVRARAAFVFASHEVWQFSIAGRELPVDFLAVADLQYQHRARCIINVAYQAIAADAEFPVFA